MSTTTHAKREYLREWLKRIQGREEVEIPYIVLRDVIYLLTIWLGNIKRTSIYEIAIALKVSDHNLYLNHKYRIYRMITGKSLDLDPAARKKADIWLNTVHVTLTDSEEET